MENTLTATRKAIAAGIDVRLAMGGPVLDTTAKHTLKGYVSLIAHLQQTAMETTAQLIMEAIVMVITAEQTMGAIATETIAKQTMGEIAMVTSALPMTVESDPA